MIGELRAIAHPELQEALGWVGLRVDDVYGTTIGKLTDVWTDPRTGEPRWLMVQGGRFGGHYTLLPAVDASGGPSHVWVPYERATVRSAPTVLPSQPLSEELDERFQAHYAAARGEAAPLLPPPAPRPRPEHAHRLGGPSASWRELAEPNPPQRPTAVSGARLRIKGTAELDGHLVELELEGEFSGTIRPLAG